MTVVRLCEDGATVLIERKGWSGSFPLHQLASQLRLYRGLRDRGAKNPSEPGPYAVHYQPTVTALEALWREVQR